MLLLQRPHRDHCPLPAAQSVTVVLDLWIPGGNWDRRLGSISSCLSDVCCGLRMYIMLIEVEFSHAVL